jgi:UDP-N-acetyl-D-glucosamine dehydrogenase
VLKTGRLKVVVIGQGYVGIPLAMLASARGLRVVGIDTSSTRIGMLQRGVSPIEDVSGQDIASAIQEDLYFPTQDYEFASGFNVAVITVPTPLHDGVPDLRFIESAAESISKHVSAGCLVVLESTTYPGTTEELLLPILEQGSGLRAGHDFKLGYSPERIDPGNKTWNLLNTPKIVSGVNDQSLLAVSDFYSKLGIDVKTVIGTREAEMSKLLENTFRHVNVALVNELARFSNKLGVNIWEAIEAADTKPFGFMKFTPGPGVGGHCLPIDPSYLSWAIKETSGSEFRFVALANEVNDSMPQYVVERTNKLLADANLSHQNTRIVLLGLGYKSGSGDVRESPALKIGALFIDQGFEVEAVDNYVPESFWPADVKNFNPHLTEKSTVSVLVTDHPLGDYQEALSSSTFVLDTRNYLTGNNVEQM